MAKFIQTLLVVLLLLYIGYDYFLARNQAQKPVPPARTQQTTAVADKERQVMGSGSVQKAPSSWPFLKGAVEPETLADSMLQKNIVMIFDGSGSMKESRCSGNLSKIQVAKKVVTDWAATVPDDANLGLIVFDKQDFSIRLPLGSGNREQFRSEIGKVEAEYSTPLTPSIKTAFQMLTTQGRKQLGYGDYTIVVVTDGAANNPQALQAAVDKVLTTSPVMIHTIGFCIQSSHTLNTPGRTVYRAANNPEELRRGLQEVLAESESFDISGFSEESGNAHE